MRPCRDRLQHGPRYGHQSSDKHLHFPTLDCGIWWQPWYYCNPSTWKWVHCLTLPLHTLWLLWVMKFVECYTQHTPWLTKVVQMDMICHWCCHWHRGHTLSSIKMTRSYMLITRAKWCTWLDRLIYGSLNKLLPYIIYCFHGVIYANK